MDVIGMVGKSAEGLKHLETLKSSAATMFNLLICWYCFLHNKIIEKRIVVDRMTGG